MDIQRVKRGYYEVELILLTLDPQRLEDFKLTDMYFDILEKSICWAPGFWLGSYNRWKSTRKEFYELFEVIGGKVIARNRKY